MDAVHAFQALIDSYRARYEAHDAQGCAALYAEDGEVHSAFGPPAVGRPAIESVHRDWFEDGETNKTMMVTRAGARDDMGYCLVQFEADIPAESGGSERFRGTSLNVLERRADGGWNIKLTSLYGLVDQGA